MRTVMQMWSMTTTSPHNECQLCMMFSVTLHIARLLGRSDYIIWLSVLQDRSSCVLIYQQHKVMSQQATRVVQCLCHCVLEAFSMPTLIHVSWNTHTWRLVLVTSVSPMLPNMNCYCQLCACFPCIICICCLQGDLLCLQAALCMKQLTK